MIHHNAEDVSMLEGEQPLEENLFGGGKHMPTKNEDKEDKQLPVARSSTNKTSS